MKHRALTVEWSGFDGAWRVRCRCCWQAVAWTWKGMRGAMKEHRAAVREKEEDR